MMRTFVLCLLAMLPVGAFADEPQVTLQRYLLPIVVRQEIGAFGSRWSSFTFAYSEQGAIIRYLQECPISCAPDSTLEPRKVVQLALVPAMAGWPGRIVFAPVGTHFQLTVTDTQVNARSAGTAIPVIAESDLSSVGLQILAVPLREGFRSMLRVYDLAGNSTVTAKFFDVTSGALLLSTSLALINPESYEPWRAFTPGYAQLPFSWSTLELTGRNTVRIEITPADGTRVWGFVSVTQNETQQFTAYLPR